MRRQDGTARNKRRKEIKLAEKTVREMPCLPSTATGEQHVQYQEIFCNFSSVRLWGVFFLHSKSFGSKTAPCYSALSRYTITNQIIFMFLIPDSSKEPQ